METLPNLDMDILRTLVAIGEAGGVNRAAAVVGRSQSAVSLQVQRLESRLGERLYRREGRRLVPTEAGDLLLGFARRILALNDEAVTAIRGGGLSGVVRFGMPEDFAETWLPAALAGFQRSHPGVRIEARAQRNGPLLASLDHGALDLALALGFAERPDAERVARIPMAWIGPPEGLPSGRDGRAEPLPLVLFDPPCLFRQAAMEALDAAGLKWRVAVTSPSLAGIWAAVGAGLGVTLRTRASPPASLRLLGPSDGMPPLPDIDLALHHGRRALGPAAARLREVLRETVPASVRRGA